MNATGVGSAIAADVAAGIEVAGQFLDANSAAQATALSRRWFGAHEQHAFAATRERIEASITCRPCLPPPPQLSKGVPTMLKPIGVAAVLVAAGALLLPVSASAAAQPLPFKATFSGTAVLTSQTTGTFAGTGTASHLGRITTVGNAVVTGITTTICPGGFANTNVNTETLTAANGDTLTIASDDEGCPTGPGQYHGTGHWNVTGGTGRFSGATGDGSFDGHSDFGAGTFAIDLIGTLVLDH